MTLLLFEFTNSQVSNDYGIPTGGIGAIQSPDRAHPAKLHQPPAIQTALDPKRETKAKFVDSMAACSARKRFEE